jgi:hypothetical protein
VLPLAGAARRVGVTPTPLRAIRSPFVPVAAERAEGPSAELVRLRLVRGLLEQGLPEGELAHATSAELARAIAALPPVMPSGAPLRTVRQVEATVLSAVRGVDLARAELLLSLAALDLEPRSFVFELVVPLLRRVPASERATHRALSAVLSSTRRNLAGAFPPAVGRSLVVANAPGDRRDTEALTAALLGTVLGYRTVYLGARVPWKELTPALRQSRPSLAVVCFSSPFGGDPSRELQRLAAAVRPAPLIAVGRRAQFARFDGVSCASLEELELAAGPPAFGS